MEGSSLSIHLFSLPCAHLIFEFLGAQDVLRLEATSLAGLESGRHERTLIGRTAIWIEALHVKLAKGLISTCAYSPLGRLLVQACIGPLGEALSSPLHRLVTQRSLADDVQEYYHGSRILSTVSSHCAAQWFLDADQHDEGVTAEGFYRLAQAFGTNVDVTALKEAMRFVSHGFQLLLLREHVAGKKERQHRVREGEKRLEEVDLYSALASSSNPVVASALKALPLKARNALKRLLLEVLPDADLAVRQLSGFSDHFKGVLSPKIHSFAPDEAAIRLSRGNTLIEAFHVNLSITEVLLKHLIEAHVSACLSYRRMLHLLIAYLSGTMPQPGSAGASASLLSTDFPSLSIPPGACVLRLSGDARSYEDIRNSLLDVVLLRGMGLPISLSVLYSAIASGAGLHGLSASALPGHVMVRVDENQMIRKREAALRGGTSAGARLSMLPPPPPGASAAASDSNGSAAGASAEIKPLLLLDPFRGGLIRDNIDGVIMPHHLPMTEPPTLWGRSLNNMINSVQSYSAAGENPAFSVVFARLQSIMSAAPEVDMVVRASSSAISALRSERPTAGYQTLFVPPSLSEASLHRRYIASFHRASGRGDVLAMGAGNGGASGEVQLVESAIAVMGPDIHAIMKVARHHERKRAAAIAAAAGGDGGSGGSTASSTSTTASGGSSRPRRATLFQMPSGAVQQPGRASVMVGGSAGAYRASAYQPTGSLDKAAQTAFALSKRICSLVAASKKDHGDSNYIPLLPEWEKAARLHPFAIEHKRAVGALFAYFCYASGLSSAEDVIQIIEGGMDAKLPFISVEVDAILKGAADDGEGSTAATSASFSSFLFPEGVWRIYPDLGAVSSPSSPGFPLQIRLLIAIRRVLDGLRDDVVEDKLWPAAVEGRPLRRANKVEGGSVASSASSSSSSSFVEPLGLISAAVAHAILSYTPPKGIDSVDATVSAASDAGSAKQSTTSEDSEDEEEEEQPWRRWPGSSTDGSSAAVAPLGTCFLLPGASAIRVMDGAMGTVFGPRTEFRWDLSSPLAVTSSDGGNRGMLQSQMRLWAVVLDAISLDDDDEGTAAEASDDADEKEEDDDESDPERAAAALARRTLEAAKAASGRGGKKYDDDNHHEVAARKLPTEAKAYWRGVVDSSSLSTFLTEKKAASTSTAAKTMAAVLLGSSGTLQTAIPAYASVEPCPQLTTPTASGASRVALGVPGAGGRDGIERPMVKLLPLSSSIASGVSSSNCSRCPCQGGGSSAVDASSRRCEGHSVLLPYGRSSLIPVKGNKSPSSALAASSSTTTTAAVFFASPTAQAHFCRAIVESSSSSSSADAAGGAHQSGRLIGFLPNLETYAAAGRGATLLNQL
jgi:Transglutaminase-like superfamily